MSSTRDKIIETAKTLFAENEYDKITLRDIAHACNISPGNLSYHFNKKEDLIMTCMQDVYKDIFQDYALSTDDTLEVLLDRFKSLNDTCLKYMFYFKNMLVLASSFDTARVRQFRVREQLYYYYLRSFKALVNNGILRNDIPVGKYTNLALHLIVIHATWYINNSPTYDDVFSSFTFFDALADSLYPYLTEKGKNDWQVYFDKNKNEIN